MAKSQTTRRKAPAAVKAPATPAPRPMTPEELSALVASWDAARTEMKEAGDAVVAIDAKLAALAPDADRTELDAELDQAKERTLKAQAAIEALAPLPEGVKLPPATPTEIPADSQVGGQGQLAATPAPDLTGQGSGGDTDRDAAPKADVVASTSGTHTTPSDDRNEGGAGDLASPAAEGRSEDDLRRQTDAMRDAFKDQVEEGRFMAADGRGPEALAFLMQQRSEVSLMATLAAEFAATIDAEIAALGHAATAMVAGIVTVTAKVDSRWRAGRQFTREATTFEPGKLTSDQLGALQADPLLDVVLTE